MRENNIFIIIFSLLFLSGCILQDRLPNPQNYSSTITQNLTQNESINQTANITIVEPPKPVLLPISDRLAIYILDTSAKGTSIITLNKKSIVINAQGGSDGLRNLKIIKNLGISKINFLIATNAEEDNIKGFPQLILRTPPLHLIHSGIPSSSPIYSTYTSLTSNITIIPYDTLLLLDDAIINIIVPYDDGYALTDDNSIVIKLSYGDLSILFETDCSVDCESRITNSDLKSKVIVSNGACDSLSLGFLLESSPELILFSGKPCEETLERIKSLDIPYLSTFDNGDIVLTSDGTSYEYQNLKTR